MNTRSLREFQDKLERLENERDNLPFFSLFDKIYLNRRINEMSRELDDRYLHSIEFYDLERCYYSLVDEIVKFFQQIDVVEPIPVLSLYSYLIKNGYLSYQHQFVYQKTSDDCLYMLGTNVISGFGVCRHITTLLTDIYKGLGYVSCNLGMANHKTVSLSRQSYQFDHQNLQQSKYEQIMKTIYSLLCGPIYNHLVTLVNQKDGTLIVDPTNDVVFCVDDRKNIVPVYDRKNDFICDYIPLFNNEIRSSLSRYLIPSDDEVLKDVKKSYDDTWDMAIDYHHLFQYFYYDHSSLYEEVHAKRKVLSREFERYLG